MTKRYARPEGILKGVGSESQLNAAQLYDHIHREYLLTGQGPFIGDNPQKIGIELSAEGPSMTSFFNVMGARLSNGYFGSKSIFCDMRDGRQNAKTILFDRQGGFVTMVDSTLLTSIRCGYMAAVALRLFSLGMDLSRARVGFIGLGSINLRTAHVLRQVFGVEDMIGINSPPPLPGGPPDGHAGLERPSPLPCRPPGLQPRLRALRVASVRLRPPAGGGILLGGEVKLFMEAWIEQA